MAATEKERNSLPLIETLYATYAKKLTELTDAKRIKTAEMRKVRESI
jgi:hypothetical protein